MRLIRAMRWIGGTGTCRLTCLLGFGPGFCPFLAFWVVLADVLAGWFVPVPGSPGASRAWPGGSGRGCGSAGLLTDGAESPADPGRGHRPGRLGPLPGQPQVRGQGGGQPQLGVGGDDDPGPPVRGGRVAQFRGCPAQDLLEEPEGVLDGLITNDKFCCVRRLQLSLTWWRRPLRLRASVLQTNVASSGEPDDPDPDVDRLPPARPEPRRRAPLGSGLSAAGALGVPGRGVLPDADHRGGA
jgi:hypothetical protein